MRFLGPLPAFWEGKFQGEGILSFVKAELLMGLRNGWQKRLLVKLLKRKAMRHLVGKDTKADKQVGHDDDDDDGIKRQ